MTARRFIVVIDGDKSVCKALQRLLRTAQMDVETYSSSDKFLLAIDGRQPDCLVLDLPVQGITVTRLHDQTAKIGGSIPVVFTTTANGVDTAHLATGGAEDVLHKPFHDKALLDAIHRAIQGREPKRDSRPPPAPPMPSDTPEPEQPHPRECGTKVP
jgi:FixJ family two-component response regulator